tara:strand:+ start:492 stop:713 length:222 start_codon:yes stop_codon:yes gene_type:complete
MSIIITAVRNPKWKKAMSPDTMEEVDIIKCEVQTNQFGDEWLPFGCTPYDTAEHGKKLWEDLNNGVYGEIGNG